MTPETIVNRYEIVETLGEGAMGLVWRVRDTTTGQLVALKVISKAYGTTAKSILQFKQEFRLMTLLKHPHCCAVYDYGELPDHSPYFTMEVVDGQGVDQVVPMASATFRQVLAQLLLALGHVHQLGFVHRDIKSANVRIRPDGTVKLMDFGLMEYARRSVAAINGTVAYLPPEVIKRGAIDQRTDLYSVGCLAYEMLVGHVPFDDPDPMAVIRSHVNDAPVPPSRLVSGIDAQDEQIVLRLLAKNPLDRFQSTHQVLEAMGVEVPAGLGGNLLTSPLMGREPEMARLGELVGRTLALEAGQAILLHGPSGIGKSRVVEEFRYTAQLANLPCVVGSNYEHGNAPYDPFVMVLRSLVPQFKAHVGPLFERHAPVLQRLLPELAVEAAPEMDSPTKEKLRLQATIAELFAALASHQGFVVILEDWQWADFLSSELVDYLLRNTKHAPILYLLTSRQAHEGSLEGVTPMPVGALSDAGVARMVSSMLGTQDIQPAFIASVAELSKGSPFFVEKLLEHLVQSGALVNGRGRWNTELTLTTDRLPKSLKGLLMWRLTCLSEAAQAVAGIGAVIGREFDLELLQALSGLDDEALFAAIGALSQNQVFIADEVGHYRFAQDQIQELLYANLEGPEKSRLHTRAAEAFEARLGDRGLAEAPLELVTQMAHHFLHGSCRAKSIRYALEAGARNASLFANVEAERFLEAGLALIRAGDPDDFQAERMQCLRHLADVARVTGRAGAAKAAYLEAVALATTLGEGHTLGRMLTWLGRTYQVLGAFPEARETCLRAVALCEENGDSYGATRAAVQLSRVAYFSGNLSEAIATIERALAAACALGDKSLMGEIYAMIGYFLLASDPDKLHVAVEHLGESLAILHAIDDKVALNTSYNFLGTAQQMLGDYEDAWHSFTQNRRNCYEIGTKDELVFALLNLAITALYLGDFSRMREMAREAKATATQIDSKFPLGMAMTLDALALAFLGRPEGTCQAVEAAHALSRQIANKYMETQIRLYQLMLNVHLGRLDGAYEAGEALQCLIVETGDRELESLLNAYLAEILRRRGDRASARVCVERSLDAARAAHAKGIQVRALAVKSAIALDSGEWEEARSQAEEALGLSRRIGAKYQTAELEARLGELALARGEGEIARAHFEAAIALGREMLAPPIEALGLFGLAACDPYDPQAAGIAREARDVLESMLERLDAPDRAALANLEEHRRVLEGNYHGFALRRTTPAQAPSVPPRMGGGFWQSL